MRMSQTTRNSVEGPVGVIIFILGFMVFLMVLFVLAYPRHSTPPSWFLQVGDSVKVTLLLIDQEYELGESEVVSRGYEETSERTFFTLELDIEGMRLYKSDVPSEGEPKLSQDVWFRVDEDVLVRLTPVR
jgi:hypothetical protein